MEQEKQLAPFVAKLYEMVSNPSTDYLIRWGKGNNTFLVLEPSQFSQHLLPLHFKHCNLSSFIRQLNIYGFRKVDHDRWEFAHESFLKEQIHLLPLIVPRRKRGESAQIGRKLKREKYNDRKEGELLMMELSRLKKEQRALEEEIESVNKRLQETERKPSQLISFLMKLLEDPVEGSAMEEKGRRNCLAGEKRKRIDGDRDGGSGIQAESERRILSMPEASSLELAPPGNVAYPFCLLGRGFFH